MTLDFSRCRDVWVPEDTEAGGFWSPPPPHVKYGVGQILQHPYFLLADDMGGMKTAQAIIAAQFLSERDLIDTVIVVAPASVRPDVWYSEDLGQLKEQLWFGKRNIISEYHERIKSWVHEPKGTKELRWIITNYEYIRRANNLEPLFKFCTEKTLLVFDESNAIRTWNSAQTESCLKLRWQVNRKGNVVLGVPRCGRVLLLNGTPVAESPMDMFSQGNIMHPDILECKFITHYKARYAVQVPVMSHRLDKNGKPQPLLDKWNRPILTIKSGLEGWTNLPDLQQRFAPYVLRREAKDLGINFALPPVGLTVALTEKTWKAYRQMRDEMVVWLKIDKVATSATAAVKAMRLAQITSGFLGGIEQPMIGEQEDLPEWLQAELGFRETEFSFIPGTTQEIGREKLDFALEWHADLLKRYPDLKLLTWCRFVPELKRYLTEVQQFGHPVGVACGEALFGKSKREERETALRLLHPKTAPAGPVTVGATQGTGALGLNFTACRTVLDMSYDFSPWKKKQGDARVNRPGQTGPVSFFYLIAVGPKGQKTIDHHIMMTRLGKTNVNEWTMAAWVKALEEE